MEEFKISMKDFIFLGDKIRDFIIENKEYFFENTEDSIPEKNAKIFKKVCDDMLNSDDKEIKIELSRKLMFIGFNKFIDSVHSIEFSDMEKINVN